MFSLKRTIEQVFRVSGGRVRSGCADPFPTTSRAPVEGRVIQWIFPQGRDLANGHQALLERIDLLERRLADASIPVPQEDDWVPLVKAAGACEVGPNATGKRGPALHERQEPKNLGCVALVAMKPGRLWRPVLILRQGSSCAVGGRAALYPEYSRLVRASGGTLFFYRSDPRVGGEKLPGLLAQADMVICPVDCVNHQAYFTVKRYCKHSGTPYVVLDRSDMPTFSKGLAKLSELVPCPGS